jgi:DNA-binding Xre family transcriptional regulator
MNVYSEIRTGKAGEYLVCSDLSLKGFAVFMNEQQVGYDLVADTGKNLLRVQVKTSIKPRTSQVSKGHCAYVYNPRCYGQGGRKNYTIGDVDVFAFVALDIMKVAYIKSKDVRQIMQIFHQEASRGKFLYEKITNTYNEVIALKGKLSQKEMAERFNISETTVGKMLRGKYKQPSIQVRYFLDFCRDREWFLNL